MIIKIKRRLFFQFLIFLFVNLIELSSTNEQNIYKHCKLNSNQKILENLPGFGWDNLRNVATGRVFGLSYKFCRFNENKQFLLPDNVNVLFLANNSLIQRNMEVIQHFNNYTSVTSRTINSEPPSDLSIPYFEISGKLSSEFHSVKAHQQHFNSVIVRVIYRHDSLQASLNDSQSKFSNEFKIRLHQMVKEIKYSRYLAQLLIRDFGTHVITNVTQGAFLTITDHLNRNFVKKQNNTILHQIIAEQLAKENFDFFKNNFTENKNVDGNNVNEQIIQEYQANRYLVNINSVKDVNLELIDKSGIPLYEIINSQSLPDLPAHVVVRLMQHIKEAINKYYTSNARPGCLDFYSVDFNPNANIDNQNCSFPNRNDFIGGVYQFCKGNQDVCGQFNQTNIATQNYSCGSNFIPVVLSQVTINKLPFLVHFCGSECGTLVTVWCAPNGNVSSLSTINEEDKFLVRGVYTNDFIKNNQTNYCPSDEFILVKFTREYHLCLMQYNNVKAAHYSLPLFGGFYSCHVGNAMILMVENKNSSFISTLPKKCPNGFDKKENLGEIWCELTYCIKDQRIISKYDIVDSTIKLLPFVPREKKNNHSKREIHRHHPHHHEQITTNSSVNPMPNTKTEEPSSGSISFILMMTFGVSTFSLVLFLLVRCMIEQRQSKINSE